MAVQGELKGTPVNPTKVILAKRGHTLKCSLCLGTEFWDTNANGKTIYSHFVCATCHPKPENKISKPLRAKSRPDAEAIQLLLL